MMTNLAKLNKCNRRQILNKMNDPGHDIEKLNSH